MSEDRAAVVAGDSKADFRLVQDCEEDLSPEKPRLAP